MGPTQIDWDTLPISRSLKLVTPAELLWPRRLTCVQVLGLEWTSQARGTVILPAMRSMGSVHIRYDCGC